MTSFLHLPLDFERREPTRLFTMKLMAAGMDRSSALCAAYQVWAEWATACVEWRPLRARVEDPHRHNWQREDLAHVIEGFTPWSGEPGGLIVRAIESNFMAIEDRAELSGLVLKGFWTLNAHLDPNFKTMQQRGALALAARRRSRGIEAEAAQRQKLFEQQGVLVLGSTTATKEEEKHCLALILRFDRACGRAQRLSTEYTESLLKVALDIVRRYTADDIMAVEAYLYDSRGSAEIVTITERAIDHFSEYLEKSTQPA